MPIDQRALRTFARYSPQLFSFRQAMFIGATAVTSIYLSSSVPVLCYLTCLGAEAGEVFLSRRTLAAKALTRRESHRLVAGQALVAGWSGTTVVV